MLALSGTLAAAVLGYLAAQSTGGRAASAPAEKHASTGFFEVSFPSGWTRSFAPLPQLGLTDALALERAAPAGGRLVLGRTRTTDASLLPAALLAKLPAAPTAQVVRLGANTFYRYPNLSPRGLGASASLYALPATTGTILGACVTPRASPAFTSRCEALLATMRLASGTGLAQPPSPRYAAALSAAIARLNTTRRNAGRRLRSARTAPAQAKAAAELAVAHSRAAAALAPLSPGPVASGANAAVARALKEAGDAYRALARAAARGDRQAYRTATAELTRAAGALNQAYSQLSRLGYRIG